MRKPQPVQGLCRPGFLHISPGCPFWHPICGQRCFECEQVADSAYPSESCPPSSKPHDEKMPASYSFHNHQRRRKEHIPSMTNNQPPQQKWIDIECQLDEIILQMNSGVPEEHIMRSIGISHEEWFLYKAQRLTPVISLLRASAFGPLFDPPKEKPAGAASFKTRSGRYRIAP